MTKKAPYKEVKVTVDNRDIVIRIKGDHPLWTQDLVELQNVVEAIGRDVQASLAFLARRDPTELQVELLNTDAYMQTLVEQSLDKLALERKLYPGTKADDNSMVNMSPAERAERLERLKELMDIAVLQQRREILDEADIDPDEAKLQVELSRQAIVDRFDRKRKGTPDTGPLIKKLLDH
jgi:hypothetical protein